MKKTTILLFAACLLSSVAFASNSQKPDEGARKLSFNDFREACLNPSKFHNQMAPTDIKIVCKDVQAKWVADSDGSMSMDNGRRITTSVVSDKYVSDAVTGALPCSAQVAACPRFKQVLETVESVRAVSCDDLVAFHGTAIDFCASTVNALRSANPASVSTLATGQVVDLCSGYAGQTRGQR